MPKFKYTISVNYNNSPGYRPYSVIVTQDQKEIAQFHGNKRSSLLLAAARAIESTEAGPKPAKVAAS